MMSKIKTDFWMKSEVHSSHKWSFFHFLKIKSHFDLCEYWMINNVKFWQSLSSLIKTLTFINQQIEKMIIQSLFISNNTMLLKLDDWNKTLKVFNVMQFMNMTKLNLTAQQAKWDIDIKQLNCFECVIISLLSSDIL